MADEQTTQTGTETAKTDSTTVKTEGTVLTQGAQTEQKTEDGEQKTSTKTEAKTEGAKEAKTEAPAIDAKALKLPEGFTADEAVLKSATDILLDDKLSPQDRMQKLVDFHAAELKKASEASSKYWGDLQAEWQAKAKETYGPEPAKSPKIVAVSKLIDSLGEKPAGELRDALEMSGMGNHPAIIAAFVNLAERLGEPKHVSGNPPSGRPATAAEAIYGKGTT
jgi:hypothetical protein